MKNDIDISKTNIGDYIEIEGELQKNPLINYLDIFSDVFRLADVFFEEPQLGQKKQSKNKQCKDNETVRQIQALADYLKHTGTIDFILTDNKCSVVLSAQEQYLANDNISELIGGCFKVLGKVISICKNDSESIDLIRKTTLSILPENMPADIILILIIREE